MPQKSKVEIEENVKGIRMYLAGKISMNELARKLGINWYTAAEWVRNYEAEGLDAFIRHKNDTYSRNVKQQTVKEYQRGGGSLSDICRKYKIRDPKKRFGHGSRCIILMEISTPKKTQEGKVT